MIKAVIFDLDGVLVELKDAHFECLNRALAGIGEEYVISIDDHYGKFDGLPTRNKLQMLTEDRGLPEKEYWQINDWKQRFTIGYIEDRVERSQDLRNLMAWLNASRIKIAVASNSVRNTIYTALVKLGVITYVDFILSNQDVVNAKPNPEIYLKTIAGLGLKPEECLVVEDSPYGVNAAVASGARVMRVAGTGEVKKSNIENFIKTMNMETTIKKWSAPKWKVLIPMAGAGSRFEKAGYTFPKPLIEVNGKPMIQVVVENLGIDAEFIYIVQEEHYKKYNLWHFLNLLTPNCRVITINELTEGAACTTLLAKNMINNGDHLLIANSDQFVEWDSNRFYYSMEDSGVDGGILCFYNTHPKWSYVQLNDRGFVTEVAEKVPISTNATVGIYYWKKGSDYVKYAEQMIQKNIRTNGEFYVAPVFNEAIEAGARIRSFYAEQMWGLGTPEDLDHYLKHHGRN